MRKVSQEAVWAFYAGRGFRSGNTAVEVWHTESGDMVTLFLHGNAIARLGGVRHDRLEVSLAGWPTATTRERLNAFDGVRVSQKAGAQYLNGKEWDGSWVFVDSFHACEAGTPDKDGAFVCSC